MERRDMIELQPQLSIAQQCKLLDVSRSSFYYRPQPGRMVDLEMMRLIDEQYLRTPFYGTRSMTTYLRRQGHLINRKRVRRMMRLMGLVSIAPKPNTSKPHPAHKIYPYLLKGLEVNRPNQVWATDITYVPLERGFLYLVAIMDWYSRKVLSWQLSNTLDSHFCVAALIEAIDRYGAPDIFNTDQGVQFTSCVFTDTLRQHGIKISMDGKGNYQDNILVERLWRTVKYECLYIQAFDNGRAVRRSLKQYFDWYNQERFHQALENQTPDEVYYQTINLKQAA
jgi:putative transposase